jgi:hypothetical protein
MVTLRPATLALVCLLATASAVVRPAIVLAGHAIGRPTPVPATYGCPMRCEGAKTYDAPGACPVCGMHRKLLGGGAYRVEVTALEGALRPGAPVPLRFTIRDPADALVRDLEIVHEKPLHLLMTSADLSWFAHEHPEVRDDGSFELRMTFPAPGRYLLFHDFTPARVGMQVVPVELTVPGTPPPPVPLTLDDERPKTVDGYSVRFSAPRPLVASRPAAITIALERDGAPVTDLEPYLGTTGHLIVVREDGREFVHSHPVDAPGAPPERGPRVTFQAEFPTAGVYKSWAQFQRAGRVITVPFTFRVHAASAAS